MQKKVRAATESMAQRTNRARSPVGPKGLPIQATSALLQRAEDSQEILEKPQDKAAKLGFKKKERMSRSFIEKKPYQE